MSHFFVKGLVWTAQSQASVQAYEYIFHIVQAVLMSLLCVPGVIAGFATAAAVWADAVAIKQPQRHQQQ